MGSSYQIRLATVSDVDTMAKLTIASFANNPISRGMYGPTGISDTAIRQMCTNMEKELSDPHTAAIYVVAETDSGELVGVAKWLFHPSPVQISPKSAREGEHRGLESSFFGGCHRLRLRHIQDRPHCLITLLAVDSMTRGQGIGRALVNWGIEKADRAELDCWLTSTPMAWSLYRACGFESVDVFDLDLKAWGIDEADGESWGDGLGEDIGCAPLERGHYRAVLMFKKHSS